MFNDILLRSKRTLEPFPSFTVPPSALIKETTSFQTMSRRIGLAKIDL